MAKMDVKGIPVTVMSMNDLDFISLTDMLKAKDGDFFISDWLRNRNTVEFLGIWEQVHNPKFNYGEFAAIKSQAGLNSYKISVKEWVEKTNAIGLTAKAGRYGGTYAHKDIAFEFGMWISAEFKIYLIKEFQRLKEAEAEQLGWDIRRNLTKINYRIHTDAIKVHLIPAELTTAQTSLIYASEADLSQFDDKASVIEAFFTFAQAEQLREAQELISSENLNADAAKRYIVHSLKREYASDNGTELNAMLPKMSPLNPLYLTKKQTVFQKVAAFVEKFKGVGGTIG